MSDKFNEFPDEEHYAAIVFKTRTIHHEGDERSRTNPGHGYSAYSETLEFVEYIPFRNKAEMNEQVLAWEMRKHEKPNYKVIMANPLTVEFSAKVNVK